MYMKRVLFLSLFFACAFSLTMKAQKNRKANAPAVPALSSEQLIQNYRFADASQQLQREIAAARKAGKQTFRMEDDLRRAHLGTDLLRGIEQVTFVDSFKVLLKDIPSVVRLTAEAGTLVPTSALRGQFAEEWETLGETGYVNQLGDRLLFAAADTAMQSLSLFEAYKAGGKWCNAQRLAGVEKDGEEQVSPFMMPDGTTLYFAAQGEESLGGFDLFVTRYDSDTKQYLKAENLGMPFNSPANDYLLCIDEASQLGWLVSDRFQTGDTVCVYVFIPSTERNVYEADGLSGTELIHLAQIHSIAATQVDADATEAARQRLSALLNGNTDKETGRPRRYVINDNTVYTALNDFKSTQARRYAARADELSRQIEAIESRRDELCRLFAKSPKEKTRSSLSELRELNEKSASLKAQLKEAEKQMRKEENK